VPDCFLLKRYLIVVIIALGETVARAIYNLDDVNADLQHYVMIISMAIKNVLIFQLYMSMSHR
jgi:low temperature requirement protein LtrA